MSSDEKNVRHRFTVPVADTKVNEWIESQSNLGFSLRVLIKAFVREYGYQDATCLEFGTEVKKRGRPPKSLKEQVDTVYETTDQDETMISDDNTQPVSKPAVQQKPKKTETPQQSKKEEPVKSIISQNNETTSDNDIEAMLSGSAVSNNNTNVDTDDDGFVDPESLF